MKTPEQNLQNFLRSLETGEEVSNTLTLQEKLDHCIHILQLMCKPAAECSDDEMLEIDGLGCEEEMAYQCLVDIGAKPPWKMPVTVEWIED